jgi:heme ABC exporter ATP-binding subunit CcmA
MAVAVRFRAAVALVGRFPALAGVDLDVASGEILLVTGPNGAGKTSLLRACAGLLAVTAGEAHVLGQDLRRDRRSVRRSLAMLGHASFLYDDLTVLDNLRFAVRAARGDQGAVDGAMARLGLDGRLRHTVVGKLSAGQRRRVAIAAVVARAPRLWLLDEPHAGLDAAGRDILDEAVLAASDTGATVVLASHETDRAGALAGRGAGGGHDRGGRRVCRSRPCRRRARAALGGARPCCVTPCSWRART